MGTEDEATVNLVEKEIKENGVNIDKTSYDALQKTYKGGYLDGMIAGLYSAGCNKEDISKYLGADISYVEQEIYYFRRSCEDSEKMSEHIYQTKINTESDKKDDSEEKGEEYEEVTLLEN